MALGGYDQRLLAGIVVGLSITGGTVAYATGAFASIGLTVTSVDLLLPVGFLLLGIGGIYEYWRGATPLILASLQSLIAIGGIGAYSGTITGAIGIAISTNLTDLLSTVGNAVLLMALGSYVVYIISSQRRKTPRSIS